MKTRPFNASTHKPTDKLVCGGDPVTELTKVGKHYVGCVHDEASVWNADGARIWATDDLEVLLPEPEKPRESFTQAFLTWANNASQCQCGHDTCGLCRLRNRAVREVVESEEAKAVEQNIADRTDELIARQRSFTLDVQAALAGDRSEYCDHAAPSKPAHGWVPLHNGEPKWDVASVSPDIADVRRRLGEYTGPVVPCFVAREPMTREEAIDIACRHDKTNAACDRWVIDALLEASQWHVRAEGI